jgi:hypothetical protein
MQVLAGSDLDEAPRSEERACAVAAVDLQSGTETELNTASSSQHLVAEETFLVCDGCIPAGNDLLVAKMSVEQAKATCKELPGCCGFTFLGRNPVGEVSIYFKSAWSIVPVESRPWTSYRYVAAGIQMEEPPSVEMLVHVALQPSSKVDFPQITELCDRTEASPRDMVAVTTLLLAVLCGPIGFKEKLKVLTIMNEMLYNSEALACFYQAPGLPATLTALMATKDSGLGEVADQSIRMLATEIDKACAVSLCSESPNSSLSSSGSSVGSGRRRRRLPAAPSAAQVRRKLERTSTALERTTSSMRESAEKAAAESLSTALSIADMAEKAAAESLSSAEKAAAVSFSTALSIVEKSADSTASSMQRALSDVRSFVMGDTLRSSSSKKKPAPTSTWEFSHPSNLGYYDTPAWMVERSQQIPDIDLQVQWERRSVAI